MTKVHIFGGLLMGSATGIIAGLVAGVILRYAYDVYIHEKKIHKRLKSISIDDLRKRNKCLII